MKSLFSKILLAQMVAIVLALLVVTVITRTSLNHGFKAFLGQQEANVLQTLAEALGEYYESRGNWDYLAGSPENWQRIWRLSRIQQSSNEDGQARRGDRPPRNEGLPQGKRPRPGNGPGRQDRRPDSGRPPPRGERGGPRTPPGSELDENSSSETQFMRWARASDPGQLRDRLFLLDENRQHISGAGVDDLEGIKLEPIQNDGNTVGWIGFTQMGNKLPPQAQIFLSRQIRISIIALALALVVAATLAFLLARNVSRPVAKLGKTVKDLSRGEYLARADVKTHDEIGDLANRVNHLADTLEKNRTARKRWMADIAHELRTPVAIMKGEIEALADGIRAPDERMSQSLNEEVDHLSTLINDLQTLALADAGALSLQKEQLNLGELSTQCVETFKGRLQEKDIRTELDLTENLLVEADASRLRQLLHNLLENCCRYTEHGGLVKLSLSNLTGNLELVVEDSGPGLEAAQIERLFERFYRVESSRSRSTGGTGLGLSICKNIVEAHSGSIKASTSELGGLKLTVILPDMV